MSGKETLTKDDWLAAAMELLRTRGIGGVHHDWVLTAIDFRTGWRVFKIKGYFKKGEFDDSVSRIVERAALGKGNYDRKVFNNIWGTFTFGPENTVYLGAYRGFMRFWSDDDLSTGEER